MANIVYLDNAATTPMHQEVIREMLRIMEEHYGNPSSTHALGRISRTLIEDARKKIAGLLHCTPGEIFFTSGGTEADNMAIRGAVSSLGVKHIISSRTEHHAVLHTIEELEKSGAIEAHWLTLDANGLHNDSELETLLNQYPNALVCLMHANNETGTMIDLQKTGDLCRSKGVWFQSDTVQTMGHFRFDLSNTHVHFLSAGAHKFQGPKGVGFIYIRHDARIQPFITGGSQERNMRGGTENLYGIVGMAKALELAYENMEADRQHILGLKNHLKTELLALIPGVTFNGDISDEALYTVLNVNFPPVPFAEMMLYKLDIAGICCSGGSACTSGSNTGSHVLNELGVNPDRPSVRFSFGMQNTLEEINYVIQVLKEMFQSYTN